MTGLERATVKYNNQIVIIDRITLNKLEINDKERFILYPPIFNDSFFQGDYLLLKKYTKFSLELKNERLKIVDITKEPCIYQLTENALYIRGRKRKGSTLYLNAKTFIEDVNNYIVNPIYKVYIDGLELIIPDKLSNILKKLKY